MPDIEIKRGYEVLPDNNIRFGIRVINNSDFAISAVAVILDFDESLFNLEGNKVQKLGTIPPTAPRTAKFILKPLGCIHKEEINALITYKDHQWKMQVEQMQSKEVHCVCPFLKEKSISRTDFLKLLNSGELEERGVNFEGITVDRLVNLLSHTCKNRLYKVDEIPIESGKILYLAGDAIGEKTYYLLTAVVKEYEGLSQVLLRANSDKEYGLNGFLNEILDNLRHLVTSSSAREIGIIKKEQVINIIDSVIQRSSFSVSEGAPSVNVKGSIVQRAEIKAGEERKKREDERQREEEIEKEKEEQERLQRAREIEEQGRKAREEREKARKAEAEKKRELEQTEEERAVKEEEERKDRGKQLERKSRDIEIREKAKEAKLSKLKNFYKDGKLSYIQYEKLQSLLKIDIEALTGNDRKIVVRLNNLLSESISLTTFLNDLEIINCELFEIPQKERQEQNLLCRMREVDKRIQKEKKEPPSTKRNWLMIGIGISLALIVIILLFVLTVPKLSISTDTFDFGIMSAGATSPRILTISNIGVRALEWNVIGDQPWITVSPTNGTNSGRVTVNINTIGLSPGNHSGTTTIISNGGTEAVKVNLYVARPPKLSVSPQSFDLGAMNEGKSSYRTFEISNAGDEKLTWSISVDRPWITVNPTSGTNSQTINVIINTDNMIIAGSYSATITTTSNGGTENITISVYSLGR